MTDQFLAEVRIFPFTFAPTGWATCEGQLMPIAQNTALVALIGTTFGGDGKSNFALLVRVSSTARSYARTASRQGPFTKPPNDTNTADCGVACRA